MAHNAAMSLTALNPDPTDSPPADSPHTVDVLAHISANPQDWALFFDLDGSLIDLAPRPDAVVMPEGLRDALAKLHIRQQGALAVITGRPRAFAQDLLHLPQIDVIGLHGAEGLGAPPAPLPDAAKLLMAQAAVRHGLLFEDKGRAAALHYRLAPDAKGHAERAMEEAAALAGPAFALRSGKCVIELCPLSADKGRALQELMRRPAYCNRRPLAVGDDVTDEAMFRAAQAMDGVGLRIGADLQGSQARLLLPDPQSLRLWIERSVL